MKVSWCIPESTRDSTVQLLLCGGDCTFIRTDFKLWLYDKHLPAVQANIFPNQRTYLQRQVSRFQLVLPLLHSCCFFGGLVSVLAQYTLLTEKLLRALVLIIPFFNQNERFTPAFIFDFQARGFGQHKLTNCVFTEDLEAEMRQHQHNRSFRNENCQRCVRWIIHSNQDIASGKRFPVFTCGTNEVPSPLTFTRCSELEPVVAPANLNSSQVCQPDNQPAGW